MLESKKIENIAFLYRMKERDALADKYALSEEEYLDNFSIDLTSNLFDSKKDDFINKINDFFQQEEDADTPAAFYAYNLMSIKDFIIKIVTPDFNNYFDKDDSIIEDKLDSLIPLIEEEITDKKNTNPDVKGCLNEISFRKACEEYFNKHLEEQGKPSEDFDSLAKSGKLYCPPGKEHTWKSNLKWLKIHFLQGTEFVIMSEINKESKFRTNGLIGSGFFREIATCYKVGYRFEKINNSIIMKHPNPEILKTLAPEAIQINFSEMEAQFDLAIEDFNKAKAIDESIDTIFRADDKKRKSLSKPELKSPVYRKSRPSEEKFDASLSSTSTSISTARAPVVETPGSSNIVATEPKDAPSTNPTEERLGYPKTGY